MMMMMIIITITIIIINNTSTAKGGKRSAECSEWYNGKSSLNLRKRVADQANANISIINMA